MSTCIHTPSSDRTPTPSWHRRHAAKVYGMIRREKFGYCAELYLALRLPDEATTTGDLCFQKNNILVVPWKKFTAPESAWAKRLVEAQAWTDATYDEFVQHFLTPIKDNP